MEKDFYEVREFCELYHIGRTTFYREVKRGRLHPFKFGHKTLIPAWEADRWNRYRYQPFRKKRAKVKAEKPKATFSFKRVFKLFYRPRPSEPSYADL